MSVVRQFPSNSFNIHNLYSDARQMFFTVAKLIMKPRYFKQMKEGVLKYSEVDFSSMSSSHLLHSSECQAISNVISDELEVMEDENKDLMMSDLKYCVLNMVSYMQSHLPLENKFLENIGYLHPNNRTQWTEGTDTLSLVKAAIHVAKEFNRFDKNELMSIKVQLQMYQSFGETEVPKYDDKVHRIDHWWGKIFNLLEMERKEPPKELIKLVKMSLVLAHKKKL